jgi:hypothetical protein
MSATMTKPTEPQESPSIEEPAVGKCWCAYGAFYCAVDPASIKLPTPCDGMKKGGAQQPADIPRLGSTIGKC